MGVGVGATPGSMTDAGMLARSVDLGERCPACNEPVLLGHLARSVCTKGHRWERCSATYAIIATPAERTCVGCCRRTLRPPAVRPPMSLIPQQSSAPQGQEGNQTSNVKQMEASGSEDEEEDWVAHEILMASSFCICGNRFARMV
ncbi:hypothetical protein DL93DRAFT_1482938 [Clavulina sp. PMI_390]|nr:hypothetical protein DL93DRAFT_1482938 [Clavulina sp. PMI_390]